MQAQAGVLLTTALDLAPKVLLVNGKVATICNRIFKAWEAGAAPLRLAFNLATMAKEGLVRLVSCGCVVGC